MKLTVALIPAAFLTVMGGCSQPPTVSLGYSRSAEYSIPAGIKRLAIARFTGKSAADTKWADIASDRLASAIDEAGRHDHRYEIVERERLKEVVDEQDLRAVSGDTAASKLGKLLGADAVIYGTVTVATEQRRARRTMGTYQIRRFAMVGITFHMVDVNTARRLVSLSIRREYDSSKVHGDDKREQILRMIIPYDVPPADTSLDELVAQCAERFVRKIAPHRVTVLVPLEAGEQTKLVDAGNKLAKTGEFAAAMEYYKRAIARDSEDYGAIFNAGVMYEAQRRFPKAAEMYKKAFDLGMAQKFADAWNRVRREGNGR